MKNNAEHPIVSREEWLVRRRELLTKEKELTRRGDEVAAMRRELPWVMVEEDYRLETAKGPVSLIELFEGRSQLLVYHFMFGPDYEAGCPSCSAVADGFDGIRVHLAHHDVSLVAVSRAPIAKLEDYRERMGWSFPWYSSAQSTFNQDFNVSFSESQQREGKIEYNYKFDAHAMDASPMPAPVEQMAATCGTDAATYTRDRPGLSSFVQKDGVVYHGYSTYARGLDGLWNMYQWLDRAPLGRNETGFWWRRHDEYETTKKPGCCGE